MQTLSQGTRGFHVQLLQRLLNKNGARPPLVEDGVFGRLTQGAVTAFQTSRRLLPANGVATQAVFHALGLRVEIEHPTQLFGQPTNMSCWSAALTMMRGTNASYGSGGAQVAASGGLPTTPQNIAEFARSNGMQVLSSMRSVPVPSLISMLRRGPLYVIGAGTNGPNRWSHASLITAIYSDDAPDGSGTMMRIHDPWPPGRGAVYGVFYTGAQQRVLAATYDLFGAYILG